MGDDPSPKPDAPHRADDAAARNFAASLLLALTESARRSNRGQADLGVALHRAGLTGAPAQIRPALQLLRERGCVKDLVPLSDGGLILTVTGQTLPELAIRSEWLPRDDDGTPPASPSS